ncbi:hypothetical protein DFH27DRAFT_584621 [Peziza echinospora]|nr:hypothetical protein DFH27DRAFT_584621 [Peziza echinospora]
MSLSLRARRLRKVCFIHWVLYLHLFTGSHWTYSMYYLRESSYRRPTQLRPRCRAQAPSKRGWEREYRARVDY